MFTINKDYTSLLEFDFGNVGDPITEDYGLQTVRLEVTGTGRLVITNTGGASASEGGMGTGSDDDREKGSLSKPGDKSGSATSNDDSDTTLDPIKKTVREATKEKDNE